MTQCEFPGCTRQRIFGIPTPLNKVILLNGEMRHEMYLCEDCHKTFKKLQQKVRLKDKQEEDETQIH